MRVADVPVSAGNVQHCQQSEHGCSFFLSPRFYSLKVPHTPIKVIVLSDTEEETLTIKTGLVWLLVFRNAFAEYSVFSVVFIMSK